MGMTTEEKINTLKAIIQECEEYQWQRKETLSEIIKDLEQESVLEIDDKTIESLQILKNSWEVSLRNSLNETEREIDKDVVESLAVAIDTMCKYRKIEQIVNEYNLQLCDDTSDGAYNFQRIKEVIEDENND